MGLFDKELQELREEFKLYKSEEAKEKRLNTKKHKEDIEYINEKHSKELKTILDRELKASRDYNDKQDIAARQLKSAQDEVKALNTEVKRYTDLKVREIKLDEQEKLLKAKEDAQETYKGEIKKLQAEINSAEKTGYNKGYADGTVDGVRKGLELTADDRKMMAQIAAISAASHVPEATTAIAKEVANGIAKDLQGELPATTGSKNRKA